MGVADLGLPIIAQDNDTTQHISGDGNGGDGFRHFERGSTEKCHTKIMSFARRIKHTDRLDVSLHHLIY